MIRLIVILAATLGAFFGCVMLSSKFPALAASAFTVGGFGITWVMLGCVGVGYAAVKVTK